METMTRHWTQESTNAFVFRISSDFVAQLEKKIEEQEIKRTQLAEALRVTVGRVSQVLNNPGNLTIRKVVEYSRALGMKVAVIAYEDGDPENNRGPINSEVFSKCWQRLGRPDDLFAFEQPSAARRVIPVSVNFVIPERKVGTAETPYSINLFLPNSGVAPLEIAGTQKVLMETRRWADA